MGPYGTRQARADFNGRRSSSCSTNGTAGSVASRLQNLVRCNPESAACKATGSNALKVGGEICRTTRARDTARGLLDTVRLLDRLRERRRRPLAYGNDKTRATADRRLFGLRRHGFRYGPGLLELPLLHVRAVGRSIACERAALWPAYLIRNGCPALLGSCTTIDVHGGSLARWRDCLKGLGGTRRSLMACSKELWMAVPVDGSGPRRILRQAPWGPSYRMNQGVGSPMIHPTWQFVRLVLCLFAGLPALRGT